MNIRTILFASALALVWLTGISNRSGRGATTGSGATTAPGESGQYCGSFGCHFNGAFSPEARLAILDLDSLPTTAYIPGEEYILSIDAQHTGFPAGYGFQVVALQNSDNGAVTGFHDLPQRTQEVAINGRQYIEQNNILPEAPVYLNWTAPDNGTGDITFYAAVNVVNGNGSSAGDGADTTQLVIAEDLMLSNETIAADASIQVSAYPNPTSGLLSVEADQPISKLTILDRNGLKVYSNTYKSRMDLSTLSPGLYILQIGFENGSRALRRIIVAH